MYFCAMCSFETDDEQASYDHDCMKPKNHEDNTIDMIDQLMAQGLDERGVPLDDYGANRYDKCPLGQHDWHGTPNNYGCPGAWASKEDQAAYTSGSKSVEVQQVIQQVNGAITGLFDGILGSVSGVVDVFRSPDVEPGTVLTQMPSQIYPPNGEPINGMLTVTAQVDGYAINFCPTESDDSVDYTYFPIEPVVPQDFSARLALHNEAENTDVAP